MGNILLVGVSKMISNALRKVRILLSSQMHLYLNSCEKDVIGCLQKSLKFLLLLLCYILRLIKSLSCGRIRFEFSVHERVSGMSDLGH